MPWGALAGALARLHNDVCRRVRTAFVPSARPPRHCTSPPDAPRTVSPRVAAAATPRRPHRRRTRAGHSPRRPHNHCTRAALLRTPARLSERR
uniref:Uncharacterized protein n=1 Tax=Oryza meridionalis TaxID=40149 RepID=A0A0E0ECB5_9ORYZ